MPLKRFWCKLACIGDGESVCGLPECLSGDVESFISVLESLTSDMKFAEVI